MELGAPRLGTQRPAVPTAPSTAGGRKEHSSEVAWLGDTADAQRGRILPGAQGCNHWAFSPRLPHIGALPLQNWVGSESWAPSPGTWP